VIAAAARENALPNLPHLPRRIVLPADARVLVVAHHSLLCDHQTGRWWAEPAKRATPYVDKLLGKLTLGFFRDVTTITAFPGECSYTLYTPILPRALNSSRAAGGTCAGLLFRY
jgi:hypothetical protein